MPLARHSIPWGPLVIIHPLAEVSPGAQLGADVEIGPFVVVEEGAVVGDRCKLLARSSVKSGTVLGSDNLVCEGAIVGGTPQHLQQREEPGRLVMGDRNIIRENATLHRAFRTDATTIVGNDCLLMVGAHVAHDCLLGDHIVLTNNAMLGGHVTIGDRAYLGGGSAVHQFCRIGRIAMIGGLARLDQDVPPFMTVDGESNKVVGLNRVGLRRAGIDAEQRTELKEAYHLLYRGGLKWEALLEAMEQQYTAGPAAELAPFLQNTTRGYVRERHTPRKSTLRIVREESSEGDLISQPFKQAG